MGRFSRSSAGSEMLVPVWIDAEPDVRYAVRIDWCRKRGAFDQTYRKLAFTPVTLCEPGGTLGPTAAMSPGAVPPEAGTRSLAPLFKPTVWDAPSTRSCGLSPTGIGSVNVALSAPLTATAKPSGGAPFAQPTQS